MQDKKTYPIGYAALLTGLSPHVIRVWEKRYGAVTPARTGKKRRLYSQEDINRLRLLKKARSKGYGIGAAVTLDAEALERIDRMENATAVPFVSEMEMSKRFAGSSELLKACWDAVRRIDATALHQGLRRAATHLSRPALLEDLIAPLMHQVGEGWSDGSIRMLHEHLASNVVKGFLWEMLRSVPNQEQAPRMVVTTPAGQLCEIGAMTAALAATDCGWNALYFGPNLPAAETAAAALHERARAVALSISCPAYDGLLERELGVLRQSLGDGVPIFIGGRSGCAYQEAIAAAGGRSFRSIREFKNFLLQTETA